MRKDGFIVPILGSFLNTKSKTPVPVYKTSKKRWLENFINEGGVCKSPIHSPKYSPLSPSGDPSITEKEDILSPISQVNYRPVDKFPRLNSPFHFSRVCDTKEKVLTL